MNGRPVWWQLHKLRLSVFARYCSTQISLDSIESEILQIKEDFVVRIEVETSGKWELMGRPLPQAKISSVHILVHQPNLLESQIKWVNRDYWNQIKMEHNVDALLLVDQQNRYLEMCIGNVFIYVPSEDCWYTPSIKMGVLCGTMRQVVIQQLEDKGQDVRLASLPLNVEHEVWMSNAVRGLVPITSVEISDAIVRKLNLWLDDRLEVVEQFDQQLKQLLGLKRMH